MGSGGNRSWPKDQAKWFYFGRYQYPDTDPGIFQRIAGKLLIGLCSFSSLLIDSAYVEGGGVQKNQSTQLQNRENLYAYANGILLVYEPNV